MGIETKVVNEAHEVEQEVLDTSQFLTTLAQNDWQQLRSSVCLRFIDPWGDTVFNQTQIPVLLAELEQSAALQRDPNVKAHLAKVCRLVSSAQDKIHTYIKFVGD